MYYLKYALFLAKLARKSGEKKFLTDVQITPDSLPCFSGLFMEWEICVGVSIN